MFWPYKSRQIAYYRSFFTQQSTTHKDYPVPGEINYTLHVHKASRFCEIEKVGQVWHRYRPRAFTETKAAPAPKSLLQCIHLGTCIIEQQYEVSRKGSPSNERLRACSSQLWRALGQSRRPAQFPRSVMCTYIPQRCRLRHSLHWTNDRRCQASSRSSAVCIVLDQPFILNQAIDPSPITPVADHKLALRNHKAIITHPSHHITLTSLATEHNVQVPGTPRPRPRCCWRRWLLPLPVGRQSESRREAI